MLLTNFDLYDLHAVFVRLRFDPKCPHNLAIATAIKQLLDTPNTSNTVECNAVRKALSPISSLDRENWYWVFTENIYTYGVEFVKHDTVYRILRLIFDEILYCLERDRFAQLEALADAVHNVPLTLASNKKHADRIIAKEIAYYRKQWNADFLKTV